MLKDLSEPSSANSIVEILSLRAAIQPEKKAFTFLEDGKLQRSSLTFRQLEQSAKVIGAELIRRCPTGSRVLLVAPNGLDYIKCLFACFYAQMIAVPAYPPTNHTFSQRLRSIVADCQPAAALATDSVISAVFANSVKNQSNPFFATRDVWIDPAQFSDESLPASLFDEPDNQRIALLQYTSGSTGDPKGVVLTHENLVANESSIQRVFHSDEQTTVVGWLPFHHDMGLIGILLNSVFSGMHAVIMDPYHFIRDPMNWLRAISNFNANISGGPNFSYELLARRLSRKKQLDLDLSSWRTAFCGAEPIRAQTLTKFAELAAPYGFNSRALSPCYGLAEATLLVSGCELNKGITTLTVNEKTLQNMRVEPTGPTNSSAKELVSCGNLHHDQRIYIFRENTTTRCDDNEIGEICIGGKNVTAGYWQNEAQNEKSFAVLDESGERVYRTGDLGFLKDNHLYVSGRLKDLIIINGRNYFPQDIENSVASVSTKLRFGGGAAFSLEEKGQETLAIVQEVAKASTDDARELAQHISDTVFADCFVRPNKIVLIARGSIPKTTSGKIRRSECRTMLLGSKFDIIHMHQSNMLEPDAHYNDSASTEERQHSETVHRICTVVADCCDLPINHVRHLDTLDSLGIDSITAIQLKHALEEEFNVDLELTSLLKGATFERLERHISNSITEEESAATSSQHDRYTQNPTRSELSKNQQSLWFLHSINQNTSAYHVARAFDIHSPLSTNDLANLFDALRSIHSALNTRLMIDDLGNALQDVSPLESLPLHTVKSIRDESELQRSLQDWAHTPFDAQKSGLFRVVHYPNTPVPVVLFVFHHLICDFQSLRTICQDIATLLDGNTVERTTTADYIEFVKSQADYLDSSRAKTDIQYWQTHLKEHGIPPLSIPWRDTASSIPPFQTKGLNLKLSQLLFQDIHELAKKRECSVYTVLLSSLHSFLATYTEQNVISVGTATTLRQQRRFESLVGYAVNPIPLVQRIERTDTVGSVIERTDDIVTSALAHSQLPLSDILDACQINTSSNREALFDVILTFLTTARQKNQVMSKWASHTPASGQCALGPLKLEARVINQTFSQFPFEFQIIESTSETTAELTYRNDLVSDDTAQSFGYGWANYLEWFVHHLDSDISQGLNKTDRITPLDSALPETKATPSSLPPLHELFEYQCDSRPNAPAITSGDATLTFGDVDAYANSMAHYLRSVSGSDSGTVLILSESSADAVCCLLACSKAGLRFVNVSNDYPHQRVTSIIQDCDPQIVCLSTNSPFEHTQLKPFLSREAVIVDLGQDCTNPLFTHESQQRLNCSVAGESVAYYAYTSGSTGKPKAIVHRHENIVSFLTWQAQAFDIQPDLNVAQQATLGFDVAICEIFGALCFGATLHLNSDSNRKDPVALMSHLRKNSIHLIQLVPSFFRQVYDAFSQESDATDSSTFALKTLMFVGEPLTQEVIDKASTMFPLARVYNVYGPTECVAATFHEIDLNRDYRAIPVGRAVAQRQVFLLNQNDQPCEIDEIGEICIGGPYLSGIYLHRDDLTRRAYTQVPGVCPGLLYRTGDLGKRDHENLLYVLGRKDNQVKINGVRIELEEVERHVIEHSSVAEACAFARPSNNADHRLSVCLVISDNVDSPGEVVSQLRKQLTLSLPTAMVPSSFYLIDSLPRNVNAKIDRNALLDNPQLTLIETEAEVSHTHGGNEFVAVIMRVLQIDRIDMSKSFFDNGGNSLLAMQCMNYINRHFQLDISLKVFFESDSIIDLIDSIESKKQHEIARQNDRSQQILEEIMSLTPQEVDDRIAQMQH